MDKIAEIAGKLTEAQRKTFMAIRPTVLDGFRLDYGEPHNHYTALCRAGLLRKWRYGDMQTCYALTPLGLAVRKHLNGE